MSIRRHMEVDPPAEGFCRLRSIRLLSSEGSACTADSSGEDYALLLVEQGKGSIWLSGICYRATRGHGLIVVPGTKLEVLADEGSRLQVYVLVFQAYQPVEPSSPSQPLPVYLPLRGIFSANGRLALNDSAAVIESAGRLYESREDCAPLQSYKRFIRFQEIILTCLEAGYALEPEEEEALIDRVKRHIEVHYAEQVSLSQLAELASFSEAYFSTWFKKETGQSPIEYLTEYRLLRARELMFSGSSDVTGSLRLKEIARRVGLTDEFYFSRVFKKRTGMAPAFYMKNKPQTIATVIQPYSYHLLALGISPVAGLFDYVPPQLQQGTCPPVNLLRFRKNEWLPSSGRFARTSF
ncbi:AraC family transcriptional regulator [Paenibacillus filicis]|uniref:AraC family transcriptional regulator n=1 Tax=Paenibacillus filicis TaxID=669464 RepID=A0ABU9DUS5_9BACL